VYGLDVIDQYLYVQVSDKDQLLLYDLDNKKW
jgi:hypothetical protein